MESCFWFSQKSFGIPKHRLGIQKFRPFVTFMQLDAPWCLVKFLSKQRILSFFWQLSFFGQKVKTGPKIKENLPSKNLDKS